MKKGKGDSARHALLTLTCSLTRRLRPAAKQRRLTLGLRIVDLRDLLLYKLTLEAQQRVRNSSLSRREIIRRLGTSATQFYRLLDQKNYRKSIDQLLSLLRVLECDVELVVKDRASHSV